jgi:hypothetical protein
MKPLNGTKTHPLSDHARRALERLARGQPIPCLEFNPGVVNRLLRGALVEVSERPSHYYQSDNGKPRQFLMITDAGRAEVKQ